MYEQFFGLKEKPFEITADPKFLYLNPKYQEILSGLIYGVTERRGFIALMGEVGTGKTLMLNSMLVRLDNKIKTAFILNADLSFNQLMLTALDEFKAAKSNENLSKAQLVQRLNNFAIRQYEKGGNVVIIVDEAQHISYRAVENLRMLSNLETPKHKLVQIILSGQPELTAKLCRPDWRQLVQRISLKRYVIELDKENTYRYIQHRLSVAGCQGFKLFSKRAQKAIWEFSGGIPRKINILCDNALLLGYASEKKDINLAIINEAINDLSWGPVDKKGGFLKRNSIGTQTLNQEMEMEGISKFHASQAMAVLVTGIVIFVCLLVGTWFFFTKQSVEKANLNREVGFFEKSHRSEFCSLVSEGM